MTEDGDEWLTVREAAKLSGYDPEHVRRLVRDGKVTARKVSIVWLLDRKSLLVYLEKARNSDDRRYKPKVEKP
jgi:excisionase family DNA binding protein